MIAKEAYRTFTKIQSRFDEMKTIYSHLKSDINSMSDSQIKSQSQKILNRISKINTELIDECLRSLEKYLIYKTIKKQADDIYKDIEEIKNFIYSLKQQNPEDQESDEQIESTPQDKKLDYIRDKYNFLQKEIDTADTTQIIKDAKRLENTLSRINFEDLPEGDYEEMYAIKNEVSKMIKNLQGVEKSEKYGPYILAPLVELISSTITLGQEELAKTKAATILNFIEDPSRIDMFEPAIKRIIAKKMTPKEFKTFYKSLISMMSGERKFESYGEYKGRFDYEFFHIL